MGKLEVIGLDGKVTDDAGVLMMHLEASGCQLIRPQLVFIAIYRETNGDPCTTGCAYYERGTCPAYIKHYSDKRKKKLAQEKKSATLPPGTRDHPGKTVAEIAKILGISKNEVRRRKASGKL